MMTERTFSHRGAAPLLEGTLFFNPVRFGPLYGVGIASGAQLVRDGVSDIFSTLTMVYMSTHFYTEVNIDHAGAECI